MQTKAVLLNIIIKLIIINYHLQLDYNLFKWLKINKKYIQPQKL